MNRFGSLGSSPSNEANASMHSSSGGDEDLSANALGWNMPKHGFMQPLDEQMIAMTGRVGGLEYESDLHASMGFMGCEMKEMSIGMKIPGSCTQSQSIGGPVEAVGSPSALQSALRKFLPSNNDDDFPFWLTESMAKEIDFYSCDDFRIYEFKVRRCMRGRSHDWTECPFAHPGEKARRRDPRRFDYSGSACPDFRKGSCRKGDACEYAHGVFECWLHPARYRTQLCKDGKNCTRRVCFFAHSPSQLRLFSASAATSQPTFPSHSRKTFLNGSYDGSPPRQAFTGSGFDGLPGCESPWNSVGHYDGFSDSSYAKNSHLGLLGKFTLGGFCGASQSSSPTSTLVGHSQSPPPLSPPLSPSDSPPMSPNYLSDWSALAHRRVSNLSCGQLLHRQTVPDHYVARQSSVGQSNIPTAVGVRGLSPLSPNSPVYRRQLERLNSVPAVSISQVARPTEALQSSHPQTMNQLIATLQQLELKDAAEISTGKGQRRLSTHQFSHSVPASPNSRFSGQLRPWDVHESGENQLQTVECRELRANTYPKQGKESLPDNDIPDFGWVNELVK